MLRYLLQVIDVLGKADREVPLATLLLGYNSSANLTVGASVEALVRGVLEANARFYETTRLNIRVAQLDIVELYRTPPSPPSTRCARCPTSSAGVPQRMGRDARLPAASWSRAKACASACSTPAARATGRG